MESLCAGGDIIYRDPNLSDYFVKSVIKKIKNG